MSSDTETTVVKPRPGGVQRAPVFELQSERAAPAVSRTETSASSAPAARGPTISTPPRVEAPTFRPDDLARGAVPRLVAAALPLLNFASRLRGLVAPPDLEGLRTKVIEELKSFERDALAAQVPPERARSAHYGLCATVDDLILNSSWGGYSLWASQGMVSTFHMDVTGGERFFDLLEHLHKDPGTNHDVLTLMYLCLSIGFEGRFRVHPQGHLEVARIREGLYKTLRRDAEEELSPEWRGADARHRPLPSSMILWTIAALVVLALIGLYTLLDRLIDQRSDITLKAFLDAPPHPLASLRTNAPSGPPPSDDLFPRLVKRFGADLDSGAVSLSKTDLGTLIRLRNRGLFASGSATVEAPFVRLIDRIGEALHGETAQIRIIGHTDNVPIATARFPDNFRLSQARARSVAEILSHHVDPFQIQSEGRGALEPIATNDTDVGREQNRRTDILVVSRTRGAKR